MNLAKHLVAISACSPRRVFLLVVIFLSAGATVSIGSAWLLAALLPDPNAASFCSPVSRSDGPGLLVWRWTGSEVIVVDPAPESHGSRASKKAAKTPLLDWSVLRTGRHRPSVLVNVLELEGARLVGVHVESGIWMEEIRGWPIPCMTFTAWHGESQARNAFDATSLVFGTTVAHNRILHGHAAPVSTMLPRVQIPLKPAALRFALNSSIWAISLLAATLVYRVARSLIRRSTGRCVYCGYSREGVRGPVCPECGVDDLIWRRSHDGVNL
jgi:hypothetical protein